MIANYPGRARARLLSACVASSCLFAGLAWAQGPVSVAAPSEAQSAGTENESLSLTAFGWGGAESVAAVIKESSGQESTAAHESSATQEPPAASTDTPAPASTVTDESTSNSAGAVAPNAEESVSNVASESVAIESTPASPPAVESTSPVPAAETQVSVPAAGTQLPGTLGGEAGVSVAPVAMEVTEIKTPQLSEAQVAPVVDPAAIGAAESTNAPAP